jgi:tetratricopeptide (TPR) repeat protein
MRFTVLAVASSLFLVSLIVAEDTPAYVRNAGHTLVVLPFENSSPTPGLEWIGESFPETLHDQLNSPLLYVVSREERLRAYDRQGLPAGVQSSRATLYRLTEQMDVDYAVLGSYRYDGSQLTAIAQLLDMRAQKLLPIVTESASLAELGNVQSALAWDLLRVIQPDFSISKDKYLASVTPVKLDALENDTRGVLASSVDEKIGRYREAVRLNPAFAQAWLGLGKAYYAQHDYEQAISAFSQIPHTSVVTSEANFYLGLAAYAHGDFAKSETAFEFVAARLPLAEVYNNLGVVAARRGQKKSGEYFERAIQDDPSDADYHFNMAASLNQVGDHTAAIKELKLSLEHRPNDAEARALLDSLTPQASGSVVPSAVTTKTPSERIKHNYEEDAFRQMTTQMGGWAEQKFARSDPHTHARFHIELGKEYLAHGFTAEAEAEFRHAAAVDPSNSAAANGLAEVAGQKGQP